MATKTSDWRPGPAVCRCCFAEGCYKDISTEYFWMGKREVYSEMLTETFDIHIGYSQTGGPNSNSRLICEPCISRLRDASDFKRQVQECEKVFLQHLAQPASSADYDVEVELPKDEVKLERVKLENKMEDDDDDFDDHIGFPDDDDDDDDLDDEPLMKLASKVPKKESVELLNLLTEDKPQTTLKRKSTLKLKPSPSKKPKKKETPQPSVSKPVKMEKKKKDIDQWKVSGSSRNASLILSHSTAYPFQIYRTSIKCCFCMDFFDDPDLFRLHMDETHLSNDKAYVVDDSLIRVDITNLKCKSCHTKKVSASLDDLVEHLNDVHAADIDSSHGFGLVPLKLDKDRYQCVICNHLFKGLVSLSRHTGTHFNRHFCDQCGKNFETRNGLEVHSRTCAPNDKHYCRCCRTYFPTAKDKRIHVRTTAACKPYPCPKCSERLLTWDYRLKHLEDVHGKEKTVFKCVECKSEFSTRSTLYRHFKIEHTKEYKCRFCGKLFGMKLHLEDHTNTHLSSRPHKCHICNKGFNSDTTLKTHLITHDDSLKTPCPVCGKLFVEKKRCRDHIRKHHPDAVPQ